MKVLIVEDEMLIALATKLNLEEFGYKIVGISKNEHTFWQFMEYQPDIVLLDVKLKNNECGISLAQKLRDRKNMVPIVFTTGNSVKETELATSKIENSIILGKPMVYTELIERLEVFKLQ